MSRFGDESPSSGPNQARYGSVYEPLKSINLLRQDGETLWDKLDKYYSAIKSTVLNYQSPTTGLFPIKTFAECNEAKVRDNLYCAASSWALALAYRRIDDDKGRTHELEHCAIKCMRGILYCYMRQADKVEQFKQDPSPSKCLHSVFNIHTGDEVLTYDIYCHLQIDSLSLFLLYLVEMISSGLQIIYNTDENTDAALLPCISYPAFAVDDDALYNQTLDKIVRKLKGKYGFKRFLRDGYRTAREDKNRLFYKPAEIKLFDGIECEFPLFYIFMIIDGVFRGNSEQVKEYQILLEPVLFQSYEGHAVVPKYYYVPADFAEAEQKNHGSQKRFSSNSGRDGKLFLWGQSLYIIAKLLVDGLISPRDIDPVRRYVPPEDQRNVSMRYSNQGPLENDVVIHVALIAESQRLQVFLNTYGIQTQTPQQVEPIQIWPQQELVKAYRHLAANQKLGLSGRPERPVGCIGTSKIYRILGKTVVCYPIVFDLSDFYMSQDVMLLIDDIKNALQFIKQYWKMHGRPLFLVLIREDNIRGSRFNPVLDMLASFKQGNVGGVKVHVDRLQTLISGAVVEQLDFLRVHESEELPQFKSFEELELPKHSKVKRQTSTPNASDLEQQPEININDWKQTSTFEILQKLDVTLGVFSHEEEVICNPLSPGVIKDIIYSKCNPYGEREAVVQQELVIHIGWIISNSPELFSGMLKIRVGWIIHAMKHELKIRAGDMPAQDLYQLSPSEIKQLLLDVLQPQHQGRCWLNRRQIDGSLNRTPLGFYDRLWQILERTPNGIMVAGTHLPQQPTLSDMTMYEMNFSLLVEDMLKNIVQPEYRQIIVELLMVVSIVLERNPELEFQDKVDLDKLVKEAFNDFQRDRSKLEGMEKKDEMTAFYNTPPLGKRGTSSYLTKSVMIALLEGEVKPSNDDPCTVS
ncbi:Phosphorylase b kinase regulatory subunit beta [Acipenser ruthenus]|uniref:Phosphorylase b kinase regulatory subunit n=1 Tax=Acipenser ruthenus TaxID=7906 RepID=A0A662YZ56_ACIRT|nr:Phosphorylase b kinase regulatory subunit beta [Acipenser ruthenus]